MWGSCLEGVDAKLMKSLNRHIELNLDEANWCYSSHLSSFVLGKKLRRWNVLGRWALEEPENTGEYRAADRTKDVDVASMGARLCWNVGHSVAADHITTQVVSLSECELDLRPSRDVVGAVAHFEGEVPHDPSIRLLTLISVLAYSAFVSLSTTNN